MSSHWQTVGTTQEAISAARLLNAAGCGNLACVSQLLARGTDANARGPTGETALHCAVACGATNVVQLLLDAGAEVNATDSNGRTPLQLHGGPHGPIGSLLIAHGARSLPAPPRSSTEGNGAPFGETASSPHNSIGMGGSDVAGSPSRVRPRALLEAAPGIGGSSDGSRSPSAGLRRLHTGADALMKTARMLSSGGSVANRSIEQRSAPSSSSSSSPSLAHLRGSSRPAQDPAARASDDLPWTMGHSQASDARHGGPHEHSGVPNLDVGGGCRSTTPTAGAAPRVELGSAGLQGSAGGADQPWRSARPPSLVLQETPEQAREWEMLLRTMSVSDRARAVSGRGVSVSDGARSWCGAQTEAPLLAAAQQRGPSTNGARDGSGKLWGEQEKETPFEDPWLDLRGRSRPAASGEETARAGRPPHATVENRADEPQPAGKPNPAAVATVAELKASKAPRGRKFGRSFRALTKRMAPIVPPSPENQDNRVAQHEAHHELHAKASKGFYFPARRLLQWGQVQHAMHPEWQDLFYDLIMVAFAFQVGKFLAGNLASTEGLLGLIGLSLTTLTSWSHLTAYRARYEARSPAHRLLDAIEGVLTAASQHSIVADLARFERASMYAYLLGIIGARLVHLLRRIEIVVMVEIGTPQRKTRIEYVYCICFEIACLCCGFALQTANSMFYFLIGVWLLNMAMLTLPVFVGWSNRISAVPIHVEYFLTRRGELIMLMLGEGVLQCVLSSSPITLDEYYSGASKADAVGSAYGGGDAQGGGDATGGDGALAGEEGEFEAGRSNGAAPQLAEMCGTSCAIEVAKGTVCFAGAFIILTAMMYLYYRSNPTGHGARHHHAIRRSAKRGVLWNASHYPLAIGLIALGVSLATLQPYAAKAVPGRYVLLYCISLAFAVSTIGVQKIFHPGWHLYLTAPGATRRLSLGAAKLILAYVGLLMAAFPYSSAEGYHYILFGCALAGVSAICVVLEKSPKAEAQLWKFVDEHEAADRRARRLKHALELEAVLKDVERSAAEARAMLAAEEKDALRAQHANARLGRDDRDDSLRQPAVGRTPSTGQNGQASFGHTAQVTESMRGVRSKALDLHRLASKLNQGDDESGSDEDLEPNEANEVNAAGEI